MIAARCRRWCRAKTVAIALLLSVTPAIVSAQGVTPEQSPPEHEEAHEPSPLNSLSVRAFGSIQWGATDKPDTPNSFTLGQLDFFVTSNLSERVSVLAEIVLESSLSTLVETDLERLQLTYRFNDHLVFSAGRYHTGIGFYNAAFHHGGFFETPIARPRIFAFEDEGGVLPIHELGVTVSGLVPKTGSALHYLAELGNGRPWELSARDAPVPEADRDQNGSKATNFGLSFRPDRWRGFEGGASYYLDTVTSPAEQRIKHQIGAAYATYRTPSTEVMAEWLTLAESSAGAAARSSGGYLQISRAWGKWRPFYRYDELTIDPQTLLFRGTESSSTHIVGVRMDPSEWVGLKAQYDRATQGKLRGINAFQAQVVFVF